MVACETMKRFLIPMFALLATAVLGQTPGTAPPPNQEPRPAIGDNCSVAFGTGGENGESDHGLSIAKRQRIGNRE